MLLIRYRIDAAFAWIRAQAWRVAGVRVGARVRVHKGVRILCAWGHAKLSDGAEIYRGVQVLCTGVGCFHLGADSHIAPDGYLLVGSQTLDIGAKVAIGPQVAIFCESNGANAGRPFVKQLICAPVRIGTNVFLGARVTVLPGTVIENDVVVAAHSVVRGHLRSGWVYGGVPAQALHPVKA